MSTETRLVIGTTIFALISSLTLYLMSGPFDRSLRGPFRLSDGHAYAFVIRYPERPLSAVKLYENDRLLGPANSDPDAIINEGHGRFNLSKTDVPNSSPVLVFSSSDNTDPNTNGRKYRLE